MYAHKQHNLVVAYALSTSFDIKVLNLPLDYPRQSRREGGVDGNEQRPAPVVKLKARSLFCFVRRSSRVRSEVVRLIYWYN